MNRLTRGYWCECRTQDLTTTEAPILLASFDAHSAPQASRWVAIALHTISPALDADASKQVWTWLYEERTNTVQALIRSEPRTLTITQAGTRITWTIRPVLFLPLAHRQNTELPTCAQSFQPYPAD
ncbi:hypothetical protein RND61_00875 [Streptomyces sp. TRM76323]|uniref:MmyB-like transcription regulator ligand binding domain-containing protein n=1 Tax=Streptomyces tamarix TaxID=3078565 RepID=A0ABU3QE53_9ACTN|nr:hypothetical protein [Streptomyces tamarix]MDT9680647.1 hypothetical protein [Streptomyces tamarix]